MLPETLTKSQEAIPSLTEKQLDEIGFKDNHTWRLNAKMLGYTDSVEDIDDFIDTKTGKKIRTFAKGKHTSIFCYHGEAPEVLDYFPMAFEGDVIIKQLYETEYGDWQELSYFVVDKEKGLIKCCILPFGLTGNFILVYGKCHSDSFSRAPSIRDKEFEKSMENISANLKEIDRTKKEQEFQSTNFSPTRSSKTTSSKTTSSKTYRIPTTALRK